MLVKADFYDVDLKKHICFIHKINYAKRLQLITICHVTLQTTALRYGQSVYVMNNRFTTIRHGP